MPRINKKGKLEFITFDNLTSLGFVLNAFSTRQGGVSRGVYKSMNLRFGTEDPKENIFENLNIFCEGIGISTDDLVLSRQTHGARIRSIGLENKGEGLAKSIDKESYDGMVTDIPGVFLMTFYADCVPLFFADKRKKVVSLTHAGWRGTIKDIAGETVKAMSERYGCRPEDIYAAIGPAIGKCCFETDEDVGKLFASLPSELSRHVDGPAKGKYHIDLKEINKQLMVRAGVPERNIEKSDMCTACNNDIFFSHRASGEKRGSMAAVIGIKG